MNMARKYGIRKAPVQLNLTVKNEKGFYEQLTVQDQEGSCTINRKGSERLL